MASCSKNLITLEEIGSIAIDGKEVYGNFTDYNETIDIGGEEEEGD